MPRMKAVANQAPPPQPSLATASADPPSSQPIPILVGAEGFEPPTLCSQSRCATRLRYAPTPHRFYRAHPHHRACPSTPGIACRKYAVSQLNASSGRTSNTSSTAHNPAKNSQLRRLTRSGSATLPVSSA